MIARTNRSETPAARRWSANSFRSSWRNAAQVAGRSNLLSAGAATVSGAGAIARLGEPGRSVASSAGTTSTVTSATFRIRDATNHQRMTGKKSRLGPGDEVRDTKRSGVSRFVPPAAAIGPSSRHGRSQRGARTKNDCSGPPRENRRARRAARGRVDLHGVGRPRTLDPDNVQNSARPRTPCDVLSTGPPAGGACVWSSGNNASPDWPASNEHWGKFKDGFETRVAPHGVILIRRVPVTSLPVANDRFQHPRE